MCALPALEVKEHLKIILLFPIAIHAVIFARVSKLLQGLIRYVVTGMRSTKEARIGDTLFHSRTVVEPLPGVFLA